jgi:glycosyltransferase 2 family protein
MDEQQAAPLPEPNAAERPEAEDTGIESLEPPKASAKGWLKEAAKFALAGFILWWLYHRGSLRPDELRRALAHWPMFLFVCLITLFAFYTQGFRWLVLLKSRGITLSLWHAFAYLMEGKFFNLIVPAYVGEDFVRGLHAIQSHNGSRTKVIGSLLVDRASGVFTMLLFGAAGILLRPSLLSDVRLRGLLSVCVAAMSATLTGIFFLRMVERPPKFVLSLAERLHLHVAIDAMYAEGRHYALNIPLLLWAVVLTLLNQATMIASFFFLGQTLGMGNVGWLDFMVYGPCGMLATMLPVAPMGLGVGQVAFLELFRLAHSEQGGNLYSLYFLMTLLMSILGGGFYLSHKKKT